MRRSCCRTPAGVWQTGVATSSTDCISSELMRGSSSWPATAASTVSTCWTRSKVSSSRSMYSSSTPSVNGSPLPKAWSRTLPPSANPAPLPVMLGGVTCLSTSEVLLDDRVRLDLDEPARVEERRDDERRCGRSRLAEHLGMRAADLDDVLGPRQVETRPDDVGRRRSDLGQRGGD